MLKLVIILVTFAIGAPGWAATYYVAQTGDDSNTCDQAQDSSTPKQTIGAGKGCLAPSDTLIVKAGTYNETITSYTSPGIDGYGIPSGSSWSNPTTIKAEVAGTVTLNGSQDDTVISVAPVQDGCPFSLCFTQYVVFDGLVIDGSNAFGFAAVSFAQDHIKIINSEIKNVWANAIVATSSDIVVQNNHIHDNGECNDGSASSCSGGQHGIYLAGTFSLVEGNYIHDIDGWGVHVFRQDPPFPHDNVVRGNIVFNFGKNSQGRASAGVGLYRSTNNVAYDNVVYNGIAPYSPGIEISLCVDSGCSGSDVYNNTVYSNPIGVNISSTAYGINVQNNDVYNNAIDISVE